MKDFDGRMKGEKHRGGGHKGKHHHHHHHHGAQTFRRGRALEFLEKLNVKRTTLKQQLDAPEFQEIKSVVLGELKAIDLVIGEFIRHFELHEIDGTNDQSENSPAEEDQSGKEEGKE